MTTGTALAVRSTFASARHQPRSLQGQLDPGVAHLDLVFLLQFLVKMFDVQIEIAFPIQGQHFSMVAIGTRRGDGFPRRWSNNPS